MLRQIGHGASLDAGRIPDEFIDWRAAAARETDSMRHEREMVRAIVDGDVVPPRVSLSTTASSPLFGSRRFMSYGTADPSAPPSSGARGRACCPAASSSSSRRRPHAVVRRPDASSPTGFGASSPASAGPAPPCTASVGVGGVPNRALTA